MSRTCWLRSIVLSLIMLLLSLRSTAPPAVAYDVWSADDPIVSIGGRLLDIQVQVPAAKVATLRSTTLTVRIPRNVSGVVLVDDVSAFPMQTTIASTAPAWDGTGPLPITLIAEVTTGESIPIRVVATPLLALGVPAAASTTVEGTANIPLRLPLTLGH